MDAAKAVMGHGWPFTAGPWSTDAANETGAQRSEEPGRMPGALSLCLLSLCARKEKVRRRARRNR